MAELTCPPHHPGSDDTDDDLRQRLIQVARRRETVTYGALSPSAPQSLWRPLDRINWVEHAEGRPLLTAVVVNKDRRRPGEGFFKMAKEMGRFDGNDWDAFWRRELQAVWDYWDEG